MTRIYSALGACAVAWGIAASSAAQGPQLSRVMREKLQHTQKILEAVVTSDWSTLSAQTRALERLTNDPRWMVLKYPEYAEQSAAFVTAVRDLQRVAADRSAAQATDAYTRVIIRCVDCHRYVARARIARLAP
jgi:hypothetical protein